MARNSSLDIEFEGTVLRAYPYGDSHLILKILSPSKGKVSLIAKSARQSKKRFPGSFDYFDTGKFRVQSNSRRSEIMGTVLEFTPQKSFGELRSDLDRLVVGSVLCESFDLLLLEESEGAAECYESLHLGLEAVSKSEQTKDALKGCFLALANLLRKEGFLGEHRLIPTSKNLLYLIRIIEEHTNLELRTKSALIGLLSAIKNGAANLAGREACDLSSKTTVC